MEELREHIILCSALAAIRGWFSLDEFSRFTSTDKMTPLRLVQTVDRLIQLSWIEQNAERGAGYYCLTSKCIKEGIEKKIPPETHLLIAEYLSESPHDFPANKIAFHWEMAGNVRKAIPYLVDSIKGAFAHETAYAGITIVDHLFKEIPEQIEDPVIEQLLLEAFVKLFEQAPYFRNYPEMDTIIEQIMEICKKSEPSSQIFMAMIYGIAGLIWQGQFKKAEPVIITFFRKTRSIRDTKLLSFRKWVLGTGYFLKGKIAKAVRVFDSISQETEQLPDDPIFLEYYLFVAYCYALGGRISKGMALLDSIRTHAHIHGFSHVECWSMGSLINILIEVGRFDKARQVIAELEEIKGWDHHYPVVIGSLWAKGYMEYSEGNYSELNKILEVLFLDPHHEMSTIGFFPPSAVEACVGFTNLDPDFIKMNGLTRTEEVCRQRLKEDTVYPVINALVRAYQAYYTSSKKNDPDMAIAEFGRAEQILERTGNLLAVAKVRLLKATVLWENQRVKAAVDALKTYNHIIHNFGDDLLSGFLRDLIKPETPEKLMMDAVISISHSLGTLKNKDIFIQKAVEALNRLSKAERGAIFVLEKKDDKKELVLKASQGITEEYVKSDAFKDIWSWICEASKSKKGRIWISSENQMKLFQPRSALCAPLIIRDQVVGVVYQDNRILEGAFGRHDIDRIQALATMIGASLENTEIFRKMETLNKFLLEKNAYYEEEELQDHLHEDFVVKSMGMKKVLGLVKKVAETDASVLITGETGVGKELVAMHIHRNSKRKDKPFVKVNCATLPDSLIESELFGHEKGAFTDARSARIGRFELAHGGTIFLDEIGELTLAVQAKFLRVLQEGQIERLGGTASKHVDVRVIAATNRNLEKEVNQSNFRSDLFYRLNAFPIHLPPLRERKADIPALAFYFLEKESKKLGKKFINITKPDITKLTNYYWPGNVRELKHLIERSAILSKEDDFSLTLSQDNVTDQTGSKKIIPLKEMEKQYITSVLVHTGWKVSGPGGAAELLDMNRNTLVTRIKKLNINKPWEEKDK